MVTTRSHLLVALTTVVVGIGFMSPAFAHGKPAPAPNRVDKRQDNQRARIQHGKATGEITRGEAKRIEREQRSIKRDNPRYGQPSAEQPSEGGNPGLHREP